MLLETLLTRINPTKNQYRRKYFCHTEGISASEQGHDRSHDRL